MKIAASAWEWQLKWIAMILFLLAIDFYLNIQVSQREPIWVEPPVKREDRWSPELFKALTFGQWTSAVDWLWIRALQDPGIAHVKKGDHPAPFYDFDLATDLDEAYYEIYANGSNLLVIVRDDDKGAVHLLRKGEDFRKNKLPSYPQAFIQDYWADGWWLPLTLGYTYLFEQADMPHAALAFHDAALAPHSPAYLKNLDRRLQTVEGQFETGMRLINFMLLSRGKDPKIKEKLERQRRSLFLNQYFYQLNKSFNEYLNSAAGNRRIPPTRMQIENAWKKFRIQHRVGSADPWGGVISLDPRGKIVTTTPHEKVFGLE